jgi:putative peptidoglycan lipid II flippase
VLAGSGVGLLASTSGRLYSSAFYALRDTRTPLNFAIIRIALTIGLGYFFALPLPPLLGIDRRWGVAGLTLSAGIAGWLEFMLLRRSLHKRVGVVPYSVSRVMKLWGAAIIAAVAGYAIKLVIPIHRPELVGVFVLVPYGIVYLLLTSLMGVSTIGGALRSLRRR